MTEQEIEKQLRDFLENSIRSQALTVRENIVRSYTAEPNDAKMKAALALTDEADTAWQDWQAFCNTHSFMSSGKRALGERDIIIFYAVRIWRLLPVSERLSAAFTDKIMRRKKNGRKN